MDFAQEITVNRYNLLIHSKRKGWLICKESDGWVIVSPDGYAEFHIPTLAVAKAEIDYA